MKCSERRCVSGVQKKIHLQWKLSTVEIKANGRFVLEWIMAMACVCVCECVCVNCRLSRAEVKSMLVGDYVDFRGCLPSLAYSFYH